jgi:peptidoglycan hydrolase CwlO-like protein
MDFWTLLQQTQQNLHDILVDLETAKLELELANGRADESQHRADALQLQLTASEKAVLALKEQIQARDSRCLHSPFRC